MKKQPVFDELLKIAQDEGGQITPHAVVERARDPDSPLHSHFEWDDSEAAEQYRLWQARKLIKVCVTVLPGTDEQHQVFVSLKEDRHSEGGYRLLVDVMNDEEQRASLLAQARKDFEYWAGKYRSLEELLPVFEAYQKVVG